MKIKVWCFGIRDPLSFDADTIGSLKFMIQTKLSISDKDMEQRLLVIDERDHGEVAEVILEGARDLPLDDTSTTLDECGLKDGDSLRLGFKGPFFIQTINLLETDYIILVSGCYETISDFKSKYVEIGGELVLRGDCFPRLLLSAPPDTTLLSFGIFKVAADSQCYDKLPQFIIHCNPDGVPMDEPEPGFDLLCRTKEYEDDNASKELQITVEFPNMPWRSPLFYESTDTIGTVMMDIIAMHDTCGVISGQTYVEKGLFVIFFGRNQLRDQSATLDECGIVHMDSIQVYEDESFPIIAGQPDYQLSVDMKCFDTVGMLMDKLHGMVPREHQNLIYKQWLLGDPERRLVDYGIAKPVKYDPSIAPKDFDNHPFWGRPEEKFHILFLPSSVEEPPFSSSEYYPSGHMLQITVEIQNTPLKFPLTFKLTDTIGIVRRAIIDKCLQLGKKFNQSYIQDGMFVLFFGKQQFELGDEAVSLCNIGSGNMHMGSIQLFEKASFNVRVVAPELEASANLCVRSYDTVGKLRDRLHRWTAIPKDKLLLKYRDLWVGWFLDDDERFLLEFGISKQYEYGGNLYPQLPEICVASSKRGLNATWDF